MTIVLCDDERIILEHTKNEIEKFLKEQAIEQYQIELFSSEDEIIEKMINQEQFYQVAILDINIGNNEAGFNIAKQLKEKYGEKVIIIFLTGYDNYVFNSFEFDPLYFVRKTRLDKELPKALNKAIKKINQTKQETFLFSTYTGELKLNINDILYFDRINRKVILFAKESNYEIKHTLAEIIGMLEANGFIMIHQSIIVNIRYVSIIEKDRVVMENGIKLPLSRHRIKEVKSVFNKYL